LYSADDVHIYPLWWFQLLRPVLQGVYSFCCFQHTILSHSFKHDTSNWSPGCLQSVLSHDSSTIPCYHSQNLFWGSVLSFLHMLSTWCSKLIQTAPCIFQILSQHTTQVQHITHSILTMIFWIVIIKTLYINWVNTNVFEKFMRVGLVVELKL